MHASGALSQLSHTPGPLSQLQLIVLLLNIDAHISIQGLAFNYIEDRDESPVGVFFNFTSFAMINYLNKRQLRKQRVSFSSQFPVTVYCCG